MTPRRTDQQSRRPAVPGRPQGDATTTAAGRTRTQTVVKRSVSLDATIDRELTRRFGAGGKSRFLNEAARDALARLQVTELLARYDTEDGSVPHEIQDEVAHLPRPR
jgi:hypothetical protein